MAYINTTYISIVLYLLCRHEKLDHEKNCSMRAIAASHGFLANYPLAVKHLTGVQKKTLEAFLCNIKPVTHDQTL